MKKPGRSRKKAEKKPDQQHPLTLAGFVRAVTPVPVPMLGENAVNQMTDKPLPMPNHARNAVNRSAEEAQEIVRTLTPLLKLTNDPAVLRAIAETLNSAYSILRHLEGQGAQTRPQ